MTKLYFWINMRTEKRQENFEKDHSHLRDRFLCLTVGLIIIGFCLSGLLTTSSDFANRRTEIESLFLSIPSRDTARDFSKEFSKRPHTPGSPRDATLAKRVLQLFQDELGISRTAESIFQAGSPESRNATLRLTAKDRVSQPTAWIDVYYPDLDTPKQQDVEVLDQYGQTTWAANLAEEGDPLDEDAYNSRNDVPTWHYYSADGMVEGKLVYVNYGTKQDFEALLSAGVNLTGKIALARYGEVYRGIKVENAQFSGAIGLLMYTDIRDDGRVTAQNGYAIYPHGPARNPSSVQRGSAHMLYLYPGDISTPGYPAYQNASRQEPSNVLSIPSIPISWKTAQALMEESGMFNDFISSKVVRLINRVDRAPAPIWNTMAAIPGHIKDEVVVLGCHRDAWVLGAADPVSGTVSLLEVVRAFGALLRTGWKPLRTILFTSWDAEEEVLSMMDADIWRSGIPPTSVARHLGLMTLRLADSLILPLNISRGASALDDYLTSVETRFNASKSLHVLRKSIARLRAASAELEEEKNQSRLNFFDTIVGKSPSFSSRIFGPTTAGLYARPYPPYSGWLGQFVSQTSLKWFEEEIWQAYIRVANANKKSMMFERGFLSDEGLPERPWFKNLIVGPDREQGYEGTPFPALAEAFQSGNSNRVEYETQRLMNLLEVLTVKLGS
ncbi:Zn-dependent exopeptidase [Lentinula edodes]|uniref:Zn-dependent exopeptidase n=1 Tax=Lentinula edodes TaxID=5353 RepID=A0A1Q3DXH0_LENED|nr:Zn-dependent exopeptidase [Lentinula edodes]